MPLFTYPDGEYGLSYDAVASSAEARAVSTIFNCSHSETATIIIPSSTTGSSTAGYTVWANNSRPFITAVKPYMSNFDIQYADAMTKWNVINPSFSANWVDITSSGLVVAGNDCFIINGAVRFLRLQNPSMSSTTGSFAFCWSNNSEVGI